ncbi:MAG TPA: hypothetical protein VEQ40_00170 [Pyrinomonadaceae bacterium]|nr:hypothetical protein [Pyrinomonadaceae bacterium]
MKSPLEVLSQVAQTLDQLGITYLVVGSVASSLLGFSRSTNDVDIVADIRLEQASQLFAALKETFYIDEQAIRRAILGRRSFNAIHFDSLLKVDVYVPSGDEFSRQQLKRRRPETLLPDSRQQIYLATPEDTILAKLHWYRQGGEVSERQLTDARGIIKVQGRRLDIAYLHEWAARLNVLDLLEKVLDESD